MTDSVELAFVVPEADGQELRAAVEREGGSVLAEPEMYVVPASQVELFGDQQFEPLTILAVSVSVAFLADRMSRLIERHRNKGGLVIDTRADGAPTLMSTEILDPGEIVVIGPDGTKVFRENGVQQALAAVTQVAGGS